MQSNVISFVTGLVCPPQHGGIVSAHFRTASAVGRGPVKVFENQAPDGMNSVVNACGQDIDAEGILLGWRQAKLSTGPVNLRAHVHGRTSVVRRYPFCIKRHSSAAGVYEHVDRHRRDRYELGAVLHTNCISVGAKDLDRLIAGGAECFEPLIGLLAVVEGGGHAMDADERVGNEFERRPLASLVRIMGLDVAIDCGRKLVSRRQSNSIDSDPLAFSHTKANVGPIEGV